MESDRDLDNERTELREDEKKLQIALQEYDEDWDFASDDDDDEDEEGRFLIDLEQESETAATAQSINSGTSSIGSASHSQRKSVLVDDDRNGGTGEQQRLLSSLPSSSFDGGDLSTGSSGVADPEKTLALNRALQGILEGHIEAIQEALERNKERQEHLEHDGSNSKKVVRLRTGKFRSPYFRIGSEYPEPNEDVLAKRQFAQMRTLGDQGFTKDLRFFHTRSKSTLRNCVVQDCIEQMIRPLMTKMEAEIERCDHAKSQVEEQESKLELERPKLQTTSNSKERINLKFHLAELEESIREQKAKVREHTKNIAQLEEAIAEKKNNTDKKEVLRSADSEKVDWMRISKMNYGGNKSWLDCQKAWDHHVNPNVATGLWSQEEKAKLKELVAAEDPDSHCGVDWVEVATKLGTGRTAFQCLSIYQRNFNPEFRSRPWSKEEERKLVEEANKVYESNGFFHWRKVSTLVENRSPYECMTRFAQVDPGQRHGKFTPEEDAKLLAAVEMYGLRWKNIARFIGTRNSVQVRDRYMVCLNPENNYLGFTYDEDLKLLKYHKQNGPAWAQFKDHFRGRSASRLRARFQQLYRWKEKRDWFESQPVAVKRVLLGKSLPMKDRKNLETRIREYFVQQLGINLEDYKRQLLDKSNGVDPDIIPPRPPFIMHLSTVKSSLELQSAKLWARKITQHKTLQESIERILTEEAARRQKSSHTEKLPAVVEEENDEELMNQAVLESLQEQNKKAAKPKKFKYKKMENLLAKAFHQGSAVHVSKILEVLNNPKMEEKPTKLQEKHRKLDAVLKKYFRQENRNSYKPGRGRKFFEKDMRLEEVLGEEKAEVDRLVPPMCLKSLGTNLLRLYLSARRHHALIQEQLLNFPKVEDDPEYMVQEARVDQQLEEIILREARDGTEKPNLRLKCEKRKKMIWKIFEEKYSMEYKKLKTSALSLQEDLTCFQRHLEMTGEMDILPENSVAPWLSRGKRKRQEEASCSPSTTEETGEPVRKRRSADFLVSNQTEKSNARESIRTESAEEDCEDIDVTASKTCVSSESMNVHLFTLSELQDEQRCLESLVPPETDISIEAPLCLPCLPPNVTTLMTLKSLLLKRGELLRRSALLTDLFKSGKTPPPASTSIEEGHVEPAEQASVKVDHARENIVLVDSEGQEIKMEDYADFIEEETREEKSNPQTVHTSIVPDTLSSTEESIETTMLGAVKKSGALDKITKGRNEARNILTSNPEYNVANFDINPESSVKSNDASESPTVMEKTDKDQSQSGYELVVFPVSNSHPSNVCVAKEQDTFLSPKPVQRSGKTYANLRQKSKSGSAQASTSSGETRGQFDFPNLSHTKNEVIEVFHESSESEEGDGSGDDDNNKGTDKVVSKAIPLVLASARKYEVLVNGVQEQREQRRQHPLPEKDVVIVDLAEYSGSDNIVHFVKEKETGGFKAFESKTTSNVEKKDRENPPGKVIPYDQTPSVIEKEKEESSENIRKERQLWEKLNAMLSIRESQEYKMLRLRMQAMFLWPVLMSTVRPISNPCFTQQIEETMPDLHPARKGRPPKSKGRGRPRMEVTKKPRREETARRESYRRKQYLKQKRQEWREARLAAEAAAAALTTATTTTTTRRDGDDVETSGGVPSTVPSEAIRPQDVALTLPPPAADTREGEAQSETQAPVQQAEKRRPGRVKGYKKVYPPPIERPRRNLRQRPATEDIPPSQPRKRKSKEKSVAEKAPLDMRRESNRVPQWWKDAMLAAMMAKQTLSWQERDSLAEVPIEEDEDFIDKGDYSDDEWVQEWKNNKETVSELAPEHSEGRDDEETAE